MDIQNNEWTFNFQGTASHLLHLSDEYEGDQYIYNGSALVQKEWSRLRLLSSLVYLFSSEWQSSHMLKYNIKFDWKDDSQFEAGLIVFDGPENSLHGMFDDQDRLYINFKQSFSI